MWQCRSAHAWIKATAVLIRGQVPFPCGCCSVPISTFTELWWPGVRSAAQWCCYSLLVTISEAFTKACLFPAGATANNALLSGTLGTIEL